MLLCKPRAYAEIYNDLDGDAVNLFRVLREPAAAEALLEALSLTPYARDEFELSYEATADVVERARRLIVRSMMGHGSSGHNVAMKTGFRAKSNQSGTSPGSSWPNYPSALRAVVERMQGVVVENRPAIEVMRQQDSADTLHYVDPPYLPETRDKGVDYAFELSVGDHVELLEFLKTLAGMVVLSGYPAQLYDTVLGPAWRRVERRALADGALERTEVVWINPAAARRSPALGDLFEVAS